MDFAFEIHKFADELYLDDALANRFRRQIAILQMAVDEFTSFNAALEERDEEIESWKEEAEEHEHEIEMLNNEIKKLNGDIKYLKTKSSKE